MRSTILIGLARFRRETIVSALAGLTVFVLGCTHDRPFEGRTFSQDTTRTRGPVRQLTYSIGNDRRPAWLPDGRGVLFTWEDLERKDHDNCLSLLPSDGGSIQQETCGSTLGSQDSVDTFIEASPSADGRLLYTRESSTTTTLTPNAASLILSTLAHPDQGATVLNYPYLAPDGKIHLGIADIGWIDSTTALYLAQQILYASPCNHCPVDTVRSGIELVKVDLSTANSAISIVPNSQDVSSVSINPIDKTVFITRNGDPRVFTLDLETGAVAIAYDFGLLGIARDVSVVGTRMLVVVGGRISYAPDPGLGVVQRDAAGALYEVNLATGAATVLPVLDRLFRRPALSPDGHRAVAEGYFAHIQSCSPPIGCLDTTMLSTSDLWLFDLP